MADCEECEDSFDSEHGLEVHMGMKHPEVYNKKTCQDCGATYWSKYEKMYCDDCSSYSGKKHPNYQGKKEQTSCNECGTGFKYYPNSKEGQYCSECQKSRPWASRESNIERIHNEDAPPQRGDFSDY